MKHNHNHDECEHDLAYCAKCGVVYCKKCGKEWGRNDNPYPVIPIFPQPAPVSPNPLQPWVSPFTYTQFYSHSDGCHEYTNK